MSIRVFDTYYASDAEIEGVKTALTKAGVHFYETHKGKWGIGSAAIWIEDEDAYQTARKEITAFESEWKKEVQREDTSKKINWHSIPFVIFVIAMVLYLNFSWLY
ncbi:MAG: hypothetical protein GKR96_05845 [Gammaproteobacteria bacterium]|nr:hypothetical protein [Gammaproteobacteria bacterium]